LSSRVLIIGGLTFCPALALGAIVEHLAMNANTLSDRSHSEYFLDVVKSNKRMRFRLCLTQNRDPAIGAAAANSIRG